MVWIFLTVSSNSSIEPGSSKMDSEPFFMRYGWHWKGSFFRCMPTQKIFFAISTAVEVSGMLAVLVITFKPLKLLAQFYNLTNYY